MSNYTISISPTKHNDIIQYNISVPLLNANRTLELDRDDDLSKYPLAAALFDFPFVSRLFISSGFIAVKKEKDIDWELIKNDLKETIASLLSEGIVVEKKQLDDFVTIYIESTPNPEVQKFVSNRPMTRTQHEYRCGDDTDDAPIVKMLFDRKEVQEVFIKENYISIGKRSDVEWEDIQSDLRDVIRAYLNQGLPIVSEEKYSSKTDINSPILEDSISQNIVEVLREYIEPAVSSDGGNIEFRSYDKETKTVTVTLRGACSGCPSSTYTLKNAIEETLKSIIGTDHIGQVIAEQR